MNSTNTPNPQHIRDLFGSISGTYDLANDVITLGLARYWRRQVVKWSEAKLGDHILDCASGTGDLAIEFKKIVGTKGRVLATDFCQKMLTHVERKSQRAHLEVETELADVTQLPYNDNRFDVCSIAYGIRNVRDPLRALSEMARVTKKDGIVIILETGEIRTPILGQAVQAYFKHVVPRLGGIVSGNRDAYEYLNKSSQSFPCREDFLAIMEKTKKFKKLQCKTLLGGASYIYKGTVGG